MDSTEQCGTESWRMLWSHRSFCPYSNGRFEALFENAGTIDNINMSISSMSRDGDIPAAGTLLCKQRDLFWWDFVKKGDLESLLTPSFGWMEIKVYDENDSKGKREKYTISNDKNEVERKGKTMEKEKVE